MTTKKSILSGKLLISDISFSANINGGQGELVLKFNLPITDTTFALGDIIQVNKYGHQLQKTFGPNNLTWDEIDESRDDIGTNITWESIYQNVSPTIYTGYISSIGRNQTEREAYTEVTLLGIGSLLTEQQVTKSFSSKTSDVLIKELIDSYNASYGNVLRYTSGSVTAGANLGTGQVEGTYLECIQKICELANMKFYIDADRIINVFPKPGEPTHNFSNKHEVESIQIKEDIEGMVNSVLVTTNASPTLTSTYENAASIAAYGKRYTKVSTDLYGQDTIDTYAENYVNERKDPKKQTTIVVNRNYIIEHIEPGDTVKIRNFVYAFENIQIEKIEYSPDKCVLYLDRYVSFGQQIKSLQS